MLEAIVLLGKYISRNPSMRWALELRGSSVTWTMHEKLEGDMQMRIEQFCLACRPQRAHFYTEVQSLH